jgi:hypothetical protein
LPPAVTYVWAAETAAFAWEQIMMSLPRLALNLLIIAALAGLVALAEETDTPVTTVSTQAPPPVVQRRPEVPRNGERQREGTRLIEISGRFDLAGDRVTFLPANEREHYKLLENLALERVGQVLSESRARHEWTVSGTLTEYRGSNYLLLQKAVIKTPAEPR